MSSNMRMLIENLWDTATVSVATGTEVGSLPVANSQRYGRSKTAAITPSGDTSVIEFDGGALQLASGMVLYRHWLSGVATWRVELFDGPNQTGATVYDSGTVECVPTKNLGDLDWLVDPLVATVFDGWPFKYSQLWFEQVFFYSGRITITDAQARDGLHEFDRVYLGRSFQPTFNFSYGHQHQWLSNAEHRSTAAGSTFATTRVRYRNVSFSLNYINAQERPHLSDAFRRVGAAHDWFISLYPELGGIQELEYAMSCKFADDPALTGTFFNNFATPITVQEA